MANKKKRKEKQPARRVLAEALVERAMVLFGKRLWIRPEGDPGVRLMIPEAKFPVFGLVTGNPGDLPGFRMLVGRNAEEYHSRFEFEDGLTSEFFDQLNHVGFCIDRYGNLPGYARSILEDAGYEGSPDSVVPLFMAQFPDGGPRRPTRREQRVLLWGINMVLEAEAQGDFQPVAATTGRILCLRAEGTAFDVTVEASVAKFRTHLPALSRAGIKKGAEGGPSSLLSEIANPSSPHSVWREHTDGATHALLEAAEQSDRSVEKAKRHYFGIDDSDTDEAVSRYGPAAQVAFYDWFLLDYRPNSKTPTIAQELLATRTDLAAEVQKIVRARMKASICMYRVQSVDLGTSVTLVNTFTGEEVEVHDHEFSRHVPEGLIFAAKVYRAGPFNFLMSASPPMSAAHYRVAESFLKSIGCELPEGLPNAGSRLGKLWHRLGNAPNQVPDEELRTPHGDPVTWYEHTFVLTDPSTQIPKLLNHPDIEEDELRSGLVWLQPPPETWPGASPLLAATIKIIGDELIATTNSERNADAFKTFLTQTLNIPYRKTTEPNEPTLDDQLPTFSNPSDRKRATEIFTQALHDRFVEWLDIPCVEGLSPRAASKLVPMAPKLRNLILSMPSVTGPHGVEIQPPRELLLRELGLQDI